MAYLQLPNGKYLKVPEGMSPNEAYDAALAKFPSLLDEPQKKKGLGAALGKGVESTLGSMQTGLEALVSPEAAAKKGLKRGEELSDKYADQTSFEQLKKAYEEKGLVGAGGELMRQVPLAIAEQAPNLATMYAGAKLGARAPIPGAYGKVIGAGLGALAPSLLQQFGGNIERQAAEQKEAGQPIDISRGKALAAAAPQAALDVAASFIPLGGKVAGKVFGPEVEKLLMRGGTEAAEKLAKESFAKTLGKGLAVGAAAEIPTEIAQQMLERAQAGLSLTSPDALKEYGETAYQVGLLAPIGGAGRFIDKSAARGDIAAKEKAEEARIAEERLKADEEAKLNKEAMDEMAKIAAENQPKIGYDEQQLSSMRGEIVSQRNTLQNELDRLRAEAQGESDIDKLVDIGNRAKQIQAGIDDLSPAGIQKQIKDTEKQIKDKGAELKAAQKAKDEEATAALTQEISGIQDRLADLKAKAPAYMEAAKVPDAATVKEQIAQKLKGIDKARESGDLETLAKLATQVKELQAKYTGEQPSLFETGKEGFTYPEAERRETAQARELEAARPDMALAKAKTPQEQRMDETMDLLREGLPEPEKKEIQKIGLLPLGELRAHYAKLQEQRREVLKENPELTKAVDEQTYLTTLDEQKKKLKPELTPAAKKLATIDDAMLATQQRIDEEELGGKLPTDKIPQSLYELPAGFPAAKYNRFAEQTKRNAEENLDELTQTLFNISKGIEDDIANTPELLNKKIEGLRSVVIKNLLREVAARRQAEGMEILTTDAALKLASRVDANLRELIDRIPALPKKQILDSMGMAVEPRIELRGMPSQIKFKKQQAELADIRGELAKLASIEEKNEFQKTKQAKLEKRQEFLEKELGGVLTGAGLKPTVVQKLGKITIDPRDLSERPFANLKRALQIIKEDIDDAKSEAVASKGKVQKAAPIEEGKLKQERDPIAGLNALLPKTRQVEKLKSALYQAQNAAKPDAEVIKGLKNQLIDKASDKRSAALYLEEIEKTKAKEQEIEAKKAKQEEIDMERVAPSGVKLATEKEKATREQLDKEKRYPIEQLELFSEKELQPLATVRATPQNFMRFLGSAELFKIRDKLGLLKKKSDDIEQRMSKAPTLAALKAQRELVMDLNRLDQVVDNFRFNAAQLWQGRRRTADALELAMKELATGTTPRIEELKKELKKYAFKQYTPEYKKLAEKIKQLQDRLYEENFAKVGRFASALYEHDATVEERNAAIDAISERIQDLQVRNVKEERKILARMERQYANQASPAAKKAKEYADKARSFEAQDNINAEESLKKRVATKRLEEQNSKEALSQLPVIRRMTEQTRAFTKGENTKQLRAEIRALEKKLEEHNPGTPQHAKISTQIGGLREELDRATQPLMRTVVQAAVIPESPVKRTSKKEGVRFPRGSTTGYDYITMSDKELDALLEEAQAAALAKIPEAKRTKFAPPTIVEDTSTRVKLAEVKEKEAEARDELESAKKKLVEHNREIAATEKALKGATTPKKIAELKKKLAGLKQSSTKQELGKKIDELTKKYREIRALGSGVEAAFRGAEDAPIKTARTAPLKTGVKREIKPKESIAREATRREYAENEAAEAGVSRADYLDVLDGMERGFKAREEEAISGKGLSQDVVQGLLGKIKMPKGLDIRVIAAIPEGMAKIIREKGYDPAKIKGWVGENGQVVIVAGNHSTVKDAEKTIAHELIGHVGVEGLLGEAGMQALAKKIMAQDGGVMGLAEKLGVQEDAMGAYMAAIKSGATKEEAQVQAVRELIAHTEEATPTKSFLAKAGDFIKAMVGALRAALRKMGVDLDISTSDIYKLLRDARKNFDSITPGAYVENGKINFRSAAAVANDAFKSTLSATKGVIAEQKPWLDRIRGEATGMIFETKYVDQFAPVQAVAKKMEDSLKATQMMYYLRMHGQRMSFVSEVASNGPLDFVKAKDGKGFIIESQRGASLAEMAKALGKARVGNSEATNRVFTLWMAAQRAKTVGLNKLDFSGKITQSMLDEVERSVAMDKQTAAAFKEASDIYAKYNEGLINFGVKSGAISEKDAKIMLANKNFIPFYRQRPNTKEVFLEIGGAPAIKIGNLTDQPYLHELIGGDQPILDIFTSALQNTSMLTDMALRNMATKEVANSLASLGMLKSDPDSKKDNGIHEGEGKMGPNVIRFKVDGKGYWAEVDTKTSDIPSELLVKGLEGVNTSLPRIVQMMNEPASLLRKWVTRNPAYALRQLIRDPLNAVFVSGLDTVPVASSMKEVANMWRGKSEGETLLQRRGILGGQVLTGTTEDQKKILNDILSGNKGWDYRMAQLDKLAIQGDAATRIVMYNNFLKQGLSEMEATLATLESMNFSKRGISPSLFSLSTMVPFMNAQIQGLNVLYKAWKGQMPFAEKLKIKQKLVQRALMMWGFTMVYASLMQDDEAYQNATDEEKYSNWFVPNPFSDEHIRVPIPFEVGLLFKAVPEALVNTIFGDAKAKDSMAAIAKMAWNNVPNIGPQAVKPIVEVATNYSFYTHRDIESARMQQFEPGERYNERTTEIAKSIGGMLNISPIKIEYLIRGYTGSVPLAVASLANPILRTGEAGEKPDTRGMVSSDTPLIGSFFQPKDSGGLINKAYDDMNDVIKAKQTYNKMLEEGRESEAQAYVDANADMIGMSSMAGKFRQAMGELTKQERAVRAAIGISGKEKREALDEIRQMKIQLAKEFSSARE